MLLRFALLFLPQASEDRDFRKSHISYANVFASGALLLAVIVLPAGLDLSGRIETEQ
jgi:hypothetical protein